jgi:hypothetical protein
MRTRAYIAALLGLMINAVLFGIGAVTVLSVPALAVDAAHYLPAVTVLSFLLTPPIAWAMAPRLRARTWRPDPFAAWRGEMTALPAVARGHRSSFRNSSTPAL